MSVLIIAGLNYTTGHSTRTGSDYTIREVTILMPGESRSFPNRSVQEIGLRPVNLSCSEQAFQSLLAIFREKYKGLPVPVDCETSMNAEGKTSIASVKQ
jgi:hypothetical protein